MAKLLNIPVYVVCDADTDKENITDEDKRKAQVVQHKKENKSILCLQGHEKLNEWPADIIREANLTLWKTNISEIIKEEFVGKWEEYSNKSFLYYGNPGGLVKNPLAIARTLQSAWDDNIKSASLIKLVDDIISFSQKKKT